MMIKNLYFVRHGEAIHNPPAEIYGKDILTDEKYFDAHLTEVGKNQCKNFQLKVVPDIVYVSPLTRTLQTADKIFGDKNVKIEALEIIRERIGVRPCDKRRSVKTLKTTFPNINFKMCLDDNGVDPLWKKDYRETEDELKDRIKDFIKWVSNQDKKNIVIVTHQGYMVRLYEILGLKYSEPKNCEVVNLQIKN